MLLLYRLPGLLSLNLGAAGDSGEQRNDPLLWLSLSRERHRTQQISLLLLLLVVLEQFLPFVLQYKLIVPLIPPEDLKQPNCREK